MKICTYILALALSISFVGCGTTTNQQDQTKLIAKVAVSYVTMKIIERNPQYVARIIAITEAVKQASSGSSVSTVALLDTYIRAQIDWSKLPPADSMVIGILLDEVKVQLESRIGTGQLTGANLLIVSEIAGWIEDSAKLAQPTK